MKVRLSQHWFILNYEAKMKNNTYLIHVYATSAALESGIERARGEKIDCECSVTKTLSMLTPATYLSFRTAPDIDRSSTKDSWRTGRTGGGGGGYSLRHGGRAGHPAWLLQAGYRTLSDGGQTFIHGYGETHSLFRELCSRAPL